MSSDYKSMTYEQQQCLLEQWMNEVEADEVDLIHSEDEEIVREEDHISKSDHDSDSEQEDNNEHFQLEADIDDNIPLAYLQKSMTFVSKNGTIWKKEAPAPNTRTRSCNIRIRPPGPKSTARDCRSFVSCFELFFDNSVINMITDCTNIYITLIKEKYARERDAKNTDPVEIRGLIGMLLLIGVNKSGRQNLKDFWDNSFGTAFESIYLTMSLNRFRFLLRALRFDDIRDRHDRQKTDKLAGIRQIFEMFVSNCKKHFIPSDYLTLDEQLVAFRGRCSFRQYIPNKPAKYGLKIFALVDTKFPYVYNLEIYPGAQPEGPYQQSNKVDDIVRRMLTPLENMSCNVTMDNWFTNVPLCLELLQKKITVVGTIKSNKPHIPPEFKTSKLREINSTLFGFHSQCTLVSYVPKKNKVVLAISTMHYDKAIDKDTGNYCKPEIITFYNRTKCAVDILDKMCAQYDVSRNSRRWPLTIFFNLLNICGINALIIYQMNNNYEKIVRRSFLQHVALEYMKPLILRRISQTVMPRELIERGRKFLGIEEEVRQELKPKHSRVGRCEDCGRARDRSTRKYCEKCSKWICGDHQATVCRTCYKIILETQ